MKNLLPILSWIVTASTANIILAQGAPQVITHMSGVQFEGETFHTSSVFGPPNPNGTTPIQVIDDGLRRVFINEDSIARIGPSDRRESEFEVPQKVHPGATDGYGNLVYVGPFDENGHRHIKVEDGTGLKDFVQGITLITPRWCKLETLGNPEGDRMRLWTMRVATSSIPDDVLRRLLRRLINDGENPENHLQIVDFFLQAERYREAMEELSLIQRKFPDQADRIKENRRIIRQAHARQYLRQIRDRIDAGQPRLALEMIRAFNREGVAGEILVELAEIQQQLSDVELRISKAQQQMIQAIESVEISNQLDQSQKEMLVQFKNEIDGELGENNVDRLDTFFRLINDAQTSDLQKMSLAVSGWHLGSSGAIDNFAVSQDLFKIRDLVVEYLSSRDTTRHRAILEELKKYEAGAPEYLARMIANIMPPLSPGHDDLRTDRPLEFTVQIPGSRADGQKLTFRYQVQLPPEYDPNRKYPCIVALPGDKDLDQYNLIWCGKYNEKLGIRLGQAMRHGYIVVTVDWKLPGQQAYTYTAREARVVLAAYRKAIKQFSIDTDRVFLAGHGVGAEAAFDTGVAHPEHWAGVIGVSGKIDRYTNLYSKHEHFRLPIYCVVGEKDLEVKKSSLDAWNTWLRSKRFAECTVVEYRGRANEPLLEEIVEIFKWTNAQRRRLPDKSGSEIECKVRRPWDNYYWFFELVGIPSDKVVWPQDWKEKGLPKPVIISARQKAEQPNLFYLGPSNLGDGAILWLSPDFIDFDKEIRIEGRGSFKKFVAPSRSVLLEDVRLRGDRQHPFWAKVVCVGIRWTANPE